MGKIGTMTYEQLVTNPNPNNAIASTTWTYVITSNGVKGPKTAINSPMATTTSATKVPARRFPAATKLRHIRPIKSCPQASEPES